MKYSVISRRKLLFLGGAAAVVLVGGVSPVYADFANVYKVGGTTVTLKTYDRGPGPLYFAPHNMETTCVAAALAVMKDHGGKLVQIMHPGDRNIDFVLGGKSYSIDPNRMFTDTGIEANLKLLKGTYSPEAHAEVKQFAFEVLVALGGLTGKKFIALHNNSGGDYSFRSYQPGGDSAGEVTALSVVPTQYYRDFYFVTTRELFGALKPKGYNLALQDPVKMTDDGSMSVYCAQKGVPYINVEADPSHLMVQTAMINVLQGID